MKIKNILIGTLVALSFGACSKSKTTAKVSIPITVACVTTATASDIDTYQTVQADDEIIKDDTNTTINIVIDSLGNQKICLQGGSAHIFR